MKVYKDMSITDFDAWCGAVDTQRKIVEAGKEEAFNELIEEVFPEGIDETKLNDILWFESEWVYEAVGLDEDGDVPNDDSGDEDSEGDDVLAVQRKTYAHGLQEAVLEYKPNDDGCHTWLHTGLVRK